MASERIGSVLGWTETEKRTELEAFAEERRRFLHPAGARVKLEDRDSLCAEGTG